MRDSKTRTGWLTVSEEVRSREVMLVSRRGRCVVSVGQDMRVVHIVMLRYPSLNVNVGDGCQISGGQRVRFNGDLWKTIGSGSIW